MGQDTQQDLKDPLDMDSLKRCPSTPAAPGGSAHQRGRKGAPLGATPLGACIAIPCWLLSREQQSQVTAQLPSSCPCRHSREYSRFSCLMFSFKNIGLGFPSAFLQDSSELQRLEEQRYRALNNNFPSPKF